MAIFLYGFGAFLAFSALMLFGLGSGSGGLLFLIIALAVIGIGWTRVSTLRPGDVVRVMNPGVTYILKRFG